MTKISKTTQAIVSGLIAIFAQTAVADTTEVQFRYPDQATTAYTASGDIVENTTPIAFSSQKAAISEADAQALAGTAPTAVTPEPEFVEDLEPRIIEAGYFVKIGSFADMNRALAQIENTPNAQFASADVNGKTYYRVFVGPFADPTQADAAKTQLIADGNTDAYVVNKA